MSSIPLCVAVECSSKRSIGTIIRCSVALGATCVLIIGARKFSTHGSHGAQTRVDIRHFYYWSDALVFLQQTATKVTLFGIGSAASLSADTPTSTPVQSYSFDPIDASNVRHQSTVFVIGSRESGLSPEVLHLLKAQFHVNVPRPEFYQRLHADAILSICIHHFLAASGCLNLKEFQPRDFEGEKFNLDSQLNWRGGGSHHKEMKQKAGPMPLFEQEDEDLGDLFLNQNAGTEE